MAILAYIIIGVVTLLMTACAVTPIVINSMSKTERNEMGVESK